MSIGAANLFTRNFWKAYVNPDVTPAGEAKVAKIDLAGGQARRAAGHPVPADAVRARPAAARRRLDPADLPALVFGLFTRGSRARSAGRLGRRPLRRQLARLDRWAEAAARAALGGTTFTVYVGLLALVVNVAVAAVVNLVARPATRPAVS